MPREVIEYRAVGVGASGNDYGPWRSQRDDTFTDVGRMIAESEFGGAAYKEIRTESRTVTYGEPERVKEGDGGE